MLLVLLQLALVPSAMAQDDANPTIAILRFGPLSAYEVTEGAILDTLQGFGFINADERSLLDERRDLEGENINIIWGDGGFDFPTVNLMVEEALDQEPDVLLTLSSPVTQIAMNITLNMDLPPVLLFTSVYHPYTDKLEGEHPEAANPDEYNAFAAGTAESSCLKPDHTSGVETENAYANVVPLLLLQNPDMQVIGSIYNASEPTGAYGAEEILELGEELGLTVELAAVTSPADVRPAAEGLLSKGVEAFLIPTDLVTLRSLPLLTQIAIDNGVPVFHSSLGGIFDGATVGAGSSQYYTQGVDVSRILVGHLNGEIDVATTGIYIQNNVGVGVNVDSARLQGVELSEALQNLVDVTVEDGEIRVASKILEDVTVAEELRRLVEALSQFEGVSISAELLEYVEGLTPADLRAGHSAFLARLQCTPERVAEEQAELAAGA